MTPVNPSGSSFFRVSRSSRELIPPEAITAAFFPTVASTSLSDSTAGPLMVPSRLVSV